MPFRLPRVAAVFAILLLAALLMVPGAARAEKRVAFLLGNASYAHAGALKNPVADIRLMGAVLEGLGFEVEAHEDLTRDQMGRRLSDFLGAHADADVTMFYYAGHGMQFEGENYLMGTDAELRTAFDVESETISLTRIARMIRQRSKAALIFIDACRNNPLADRFYRDNYSDTRAGLSRGLAPVEGGDGTMFVFSASPGQLAYDGEGETSAFAASLARHLGTANVEVLSLMKRVIGDVRRESGELQVPVITNDLVTEVYLHRVAAEAGAAQPVDPRERALFEAAIAGGSIAGWQAYLDAFPNGSFHEIAVAERDRLLALAARPDPETELFEAAKRLGSARIWTLFLRKFPEGKFRTAALAGHERALAEDLVAAGRALLRPNTRIEVPAAMLAEVEAQLGLTAEDIRAIQVALNNRGHDVGTPDGRLGPRSRDALAAFQAATGGQITGLATPATAEALGLKLARFRSPEPPLASGRLRRLDADLLALFETDARLIAAARGMETREWIYGYVHPSLYIIGSLPMSPSLAEYKRFAQSIGAIPVDIGSAAENAAVLKLAVLDARLWRVTSNGRSSLGPTIGLAQSKGAREPGGGWLWMSGRAVNYANWAQWEPSNSGAGGEDAASFMVHHPARSGAALTGGTWGDISYPERYQVYEIDMYGRQPGN